MPMTATEIKKLIKDYNAAIEEARKAEAKRANLAKQFYAMKNSDEVPSQATYEKLRAFANENNFDGGISMDLKKWLDKIELHHKKGTKYKGFEIKEEKGGFYGIRMHIFKDGKPFVVLNKDNMSSEAECKMKIDLYLEAISKAPAILKKLGISNLRYFFHEAKRSEIHNTEHFDICDNILFQMDLISFLHRFPNMDKWKVSVEHEKCSLSKYDLQYEIRSQCEYQYYQGDGVKITTEENSSVELVWGMWGKY